MHLSKRMRMVADMVEPCKVLADVGCDHGYLSIWLLRKQICEKAIAMDLRQGPLRHAEANRRFFHMEERMELRLSDGLEKLSPYEADVIVCAGMGGQLVMDILSRGTACMRTAKQLVLQPQSEILQVRKYLHQNGYRITGENMCFEDGKYYTVIHAVPGTEEPYSDAEYLAGRCLIAGKHPVAYSYVNELVKKREKVLQELQKATPENGLKRRQGAKEEYMTAKAALEMLK